MIRLLVDMLTYRGKPPELREPQPKPIPIWVREELDTILDEIDSSSDSRKIQSLIELFRLTADPVTNHYSVDQSNVQICLLNDRLVKSGYTDLQVPEYKNAN